VTFLFGTTKVIDGSDRGNEDACCMAIDFCFKGLHCDLREQNTSFSVSLTKYMHKF